MIIDKIEVKGSGKITAKVEFTKGLNVIAGASDTGKSYIFQCINFIFGSKKIPKQISQSKGYSSLEVTFLDDTDKPFILKRELSLGSDISLIEFDENNNDTTTILKPDHKGINNISNFFLSKYCLNDKKLVKGVESLNHATLTLRILEKILLVDEKRIISDESPLGTGQNNEKTLETSLLKTLLTGNDDSSVIEMKGDKKSKGEMKNKADHLQKFLVQFFPEKELDADEITKLNSILESIEKTIGTAENELNNIVKSSGSNIEKRNHLISKSETLSRQLDEDKTTIERFELLLDKYSSDKERLEANSEAATYIDEHYTSSCPTCGGAIDIDNTDLSLELIIAGNSAEIRKINAKIEDLTSTINEVLASKESVTIKLNNITSEIQNLDNILDADISLKIKEYNSLINTLNTKKEKFNKVIYTENKRGNILEEIGSLQTKYEEISDKYEIPDFSTPLNNFMSEISSILTRWDFPNSDSVTFDMNLRDIKIGKKPRDHFGKGYRAICFSAFIIALMNYLTEKGRHPGFVVLDSPLTTYKQRDEEAPEDEEDEQTYIANNMIYAFYRDLCDFYKNKQIIVLDNQEPSSDLTQHMKYIHFSKNKNIGRYGFFPVKPV